MEAKDLGPAFFVLTLLAILGGSIWYMWIALRRQGRAIAQVDQSMRIQERQLELQEEANELLRAVVNNQVQIMRLLRPSAGAQ